MDATASGPRCAPTVTNRKDCHLGDEPQAEKPFHRGKRYQRNEHGSLLWKARKPPRRPETREGPLSDLCVLLGQGRNLIYIISNLSTNSAMSHLIAVEIDPVSRQAISMISACRPSREYRWREAGGGGGDVCAEEPP